MSLDPWLDLCDYWWLVPLLLALLSARLYLTRNYGVWERKGLFALPPTLLLGNNGPVVLGRMHFNDFHTEFYRKLKGKKVAIFYEGTEPLLYVRDLDLAKRVLITDFDHFTDSAFFAESINAVNDFGLVNARGEEWKSLKATISPAFNLRNLKSIVMESNKVARRLVEVLEKRTDPESAVEMEELAMKFTVDCIAKMVFSIDINSAENPDNKFCKMGLKFFSDPWRLILSMLCPAVAGFFRVSIFNYESAQYFEKISMMMLKEREKSGDWERYNDVLALMMKVRNSDTALQRDGDTDDFQLMGAKKCHLTDHMIAKTLMQFFADGADTTGMQISATLYYLAVNQDMQERILEEAEEVAGKCGDDFTAEDAGHLKFMDMFISEVGRMIAFPVTFRACTKDYELPGFDGVIIPKGMRVALPIIPLHRDPEYFDDPETFDPDRFGPERKASIRKVSYKPFGAGPRQCMGIQISRLETKAFLFNLVRAFRVEPSDKTPVPIKLRYDHIAKIQGGNWLKLIPRS